MPKDAGKGVGEFPDGGKNLGSRKRAHKPKNEEAEQIQLALALSASLEVTGQASTVERDEVGERRLLAVKSLKAQIADLNREETRIRRRRDALLRDLAQLEAPKLLPPRAKLPDINAVDILFPTLSESSAVQSLPCDFSSRGEWNGLPWSQKRPKALLWEAAATSSPAESDAAGNRTERGMDSTESEIREAQLAPDEPDLLSQLVAEMEVRQYPPTSPSFYWSDVRKRAPEKISVVFPDWEENIAFVFQQNGCEVLYALRGLRIRCDEIGSTHRDDVELECLRFFIEILEARSLSHQNARAEETGVLQVAHPLATVADAMAINSEINGAEEDIYIQSQSSTGTLLELTDEVASTQGIAPSLAAATHADATNPVEDIDDASDNNGGDFFDLTQLEIVDDGDASTGPTGTAQPETSNEVEVVTTQLSASASADSTTFDEMTFDAAEFSAAPTPGKVPATSALTQKPLRVRADNAELATVQICDFVVSHRSIYEKILMFDTISLSAFQQQLTNEGGLSVPKPVLRSILDTRGVSLSL